MPTFDDTGAQVLPPARVVRTGKLLSESLNESEREVRAAARTRFVGFADFDSGPRFRNMREQPDPTR